MMESCMSPDCEARLSVLEKEYESVRSVADRAAADVIRIERDVDRIGSEMRRLRAVMVGEGAEEKGGLRAEVQLLVQKMDSAENAQKWIIRLLGALLAVLGPEQIVKLAQLVQEMVTP